MKRWICMIALVVISSPAAMSGAQSIAQASEQTKTSYASRKVNLDLSGVTVETAIRAISEQVGLMPVYPTDVVPRKLVSIKVSNISAVDALNRVLQGSGLSAEISASGVLGLVKSSQGSRGAQGVITGKVTDSKSGRAISGANVSLDNDSRGVLSDETGSYRLAGVSAGVRTVVVRLVGYAKQTRTITVGDGAIISVDFKLEPSASVLDQVVVTGTIVSTELKAVPNAITVITAKQIEERGITRIDQLFRGDVPGMFSLNMGSFSSLDEVTMFSRGATALPGGRSVGIDPNTQNTNSIKTYVDGVEMANSRYLSQIDPRSIERIEILTGSQASTIYGSNAINGVMQIFTKRGTSSRPQLVFTFTSGVAENNSNSHLAPSHITDTRISGVEGKWSYNIGGSWDYQGSWTPSKQTQRLSVNGGGKMEWNKLTIDLSARRGVTKNRQRGNITQGVTDLRTNGVWLPLESVGLPTPQTQGLLGQTLGLSLGFRPLSWWSHDVGIGSDASTTETIKNAAGLLSLSDTSLSISNSITSRTSERYSTTIQFSVSSLTNINFVLGGDHWRTRGSSYSLSSLSLIGNFTNPNLPRTRPTKNSGAFMQGQLGLWDALFLTYGVRAEWNPTYGDNARVLPGRYGMSYTRDIETDMGSISVKLRGSYGRSTRPPADGFKLAVPATVSSQGSAIIDQYGFFDARLANPDLIPEDRRGGEGGIELYMGNRGSLIVTRFNETTNNLTSIVSGADSVRSLTNTPDPSWCQNSFRDADGYCFLYQSQFLNVGSIRNQGWETQGSINVGPLTMRGTYSWIKSRIIGITPRYRFLLTGFEPGRPFDYNPEHTWALGITYANAQSYLSLAINGIGMLYKGSDVLSLATSGNARLMSSRPRIFNPSNYRPLGSGYTTADLNATHTFTSYIDALLQVTNLTNYYQNDFSAPYATIGRQTRLGVRMRW